MNEAIVRRLRALERRVGIMAAADHPPLAYGAIYANAAAQTITISNTSNLFEITAGWTAAEQLNCTYDSAGRIDCTNPGIYLVNWSLSLYINATSNSVLGATMLEGSAQLDGLARAMSPGTANQRFNIGGTYYQTISTGNTGISLGLKNFTAANNIVFDYGNMTVLRIA